MKNMHTVNKYMHVNHCKSAMFEKKISKYRIYVLFLLFIALINYVYLLLVLVDFQNSAFHIFSLICVGSFLQPPLTMTIM